MFFGENVKMINIQLEHIFSENMKRPVYTCPYCKMNSHSKKNIARHQKSIHPNKSIKIIKKKSSQEAVNNAEVCVHCHTLALLM